MVENFGKRFSGIKAWKFLIDNRVGAGRMGFPKTIPEANRKLAIFISANIFAHKMPVPVRAGMAV